MTLVFMMVMGELYSMFLISWGTPALFALMVLIVLVALALIGVLFTVGHL